MFGKRCRHLRWILSDLTVGLENSGQRRNASWKELFELRQNRLLLLAAFWVIRATSVVLQVRKLLGDPGTCKFHHVIPYRSHNVAIFSNPYGDRP